MFRMITSWGVAAAVLVGAGLSFGQDKSALEPGKAAEELLAAKDLRPSAAMYIANAEDEVKKASDTADARLKEYRLAAAREKGALRDIMDKKAYAAELTKQRDELKQQMDQALPTLQAQIQTLTQQRNALNMQAGSMAGGGRYTRGGNSQLHAQANQLSAQINLLQAQGNQLKMTYNELNDQIKQLSAQPDSKTGTKGDDASKPASFKTGATSDDLKETYVKAVGNLRKHVDLANQKYAALAGDAEVTSALETLSQRSAKIKYVLGPSKKFLDTIKALEQAEAKIASDTIIDAPKTADSAKRKTKMAKKK
jgi:hypothetical protein